MELASQERLALRDTWVAATEAALLLDAPRELMGWLQEFVRPALPYRFVVCGTGMFTPTTIVADRVLVRGIPNQRLDPLRDASGAIAVPRGRKQRDLALRVVDAARVAGTVPAFGLGAMVMLDRVEPTCRFGSYFLFGGLPAAPGARPHYLLKVLAPHMHAALSRVLEAEPALQPIAAARLRLTRREMELLHWLVAGQTTGAIAQATHRSRHTIANHVRAILRKLGASNRTEAMALALGHGLVRPQERPQATRLVAAQPRAVYEISPREPD